MEEPADEQPAERQRGVGQGGEEGPANDRAEQRAAALEVHVAPAPATPAAEGNAGQRARRGAIQGGRQDGRGGPASEPAREIVNDHARVNVSL